MRFIASNRIFNGEGFLPENAVLILDETNRLIEISNTGKITSDKIEKYEGIICPGFVNAHCHLELSFLKNLISQHTGFTGFARELMEIRPKFSKEEIVSAMKEAETEMWENGIAAVGDISNTLDSFELKDKSKIHFHTFIELIGLNPARKDSVIKNGLDLQKQIKNHSSTLSPHAPYTASAELLTEIGKNCKGNLPLTIHNQESAAENEFFISGTGKVKELYTNLGIDISWFHPSGNSSLKTYLKNIPTDKNLILVHNTFCNDDDVKFAESHNKNIYWCFCPNANLYIENSLPDLEMFIRNGCKIVIGTDSLASNHRLSVIDELNCLLKNFPSLTEGEVLKWATLNGALALNKESELGKFIVGKNTGINHIVLKNKQFEFIQRLA